MSRGDALYQSYKNYPTDVTLVYDVDERKAHKIVDSQQLTLQGGHVVIQQFHVFKNFHRVIQV